MLFIAGVCPIVILRPLLRHFIRRMNHNIQGSEICPGPCRGKKIGILINRWFRSRIRRGIHRSRNRIHNPFPRLQHNLILIPPHQRFRYIQTHFRAVNGAVFPGKVIQGTHDRIVPVIIQNSGRIVIFRESKLFKCHGLCIYKVHRSADFVFTGSIFIEFPVRLPVQRHSDHIDGKCCFRIHPGIQTSSVSQIREAALIFHKYFCFLRVCRKNKRSRRGRIRFNVSPGRLIHISRHREFR